jgi:hypothetical protein
MPSLKMSENSIRQIAFARRSWWRRLWWRRIEPDHTCYLLVMPDGLNLSFPNQAAMDAYILTLTN